MAYNHNGFEPLLFYFSNKNPWILLAEFVEIGPMKGQGFFYIPGIYFNERPKIPGSRN
jgi:hypothetical protein